MESMYHWVQTYTYLMFFALKFNLHLIRLHSVSNISSSVGNPDPMQKDRFKYTLQMGSNSTDHLPHLIYLSAHFFPEASAFLPSFFSLQSHLRIFLSTLFQILVTEFMLPPLSMHRYHIIAGVSNYSTWQCAQNVFSKISCH